MSSLWLKFHPIIFKIDEVIQSGKSGRRTSTTTNDDRQPPYRSIVPGGKFSAGDKNKKIKLEKKTITRKKTRKKQTNKKRNDHSVNTLLGVHKKCPRLKFFLTMMSTTTTTTSVQDLNFFKQWCSD